MLLLQLLELKELVVDHLLCVVEDPLPDLVHINLLCLLPCLGCIFLLLFVDLGSLLHSVDFLLLTLHEDVLLPVVSLKGVHLTL